MDRNIKMRLGWVELFKQTQNAGLVCRRCGISRPTLRKWVRRYKADGLEGLQDQSKRPHTCPHSKVDAQVESWILALRARRLGAKRIKNELYRLHNFSLSSATVHKVLKRNQVKPLKRGRKKANPKRYQRPIPGDRI